MYQNSTKLSDNCLIPKSKWCKEHREAYDFCNHVLYSGKVSANQFVSYIKKHIYPHFKEEENISFPYVLKKYPEAKDSTIQLLNEHVLFRKYMRNIMNSSDYDFILINVIAFCERLKSHIKKEENYFSKYCI